MSGNTRELKSYVWHKPSGRCFFVSTIERESSAMVAPPPRRFMETLAWEYDWCASERRDMVAQAGNGGAIEQHFEVVRQLYQSGAYVDPEGDAHEAAP